MLTIEKTVTMSPEQWEIVIEGMRNPKNSWDRMDSSPCMDYAECGNSYDCFGNCYDIGPNDHGLMMNLADGGPVHAKYRRMIPVWVTINAPLYWWKELDTYKIGTVCNSCSTMHKIHAKEFTRDDFSCDHLLDATECEEFDEYKHVRGHLNTPLDDLDYDIEKLNMYRDLFLKAQKKPMKDESKRAGLVKKYWWQMIQRLGTSYNQKRTIMLNYEVLVNIYTWRKNHKLDEWHVFCDWIEKLPYSELIIGEKTGEV